MAILYQNPNSSTLYIGWYAGDGVEFECEDFSLIAPEVRNKINKVYQVKTLNDGFNGFDATLPPNLDSVAQPFTSLECGKAYFITLKPGNDSLYIENFTYTNTGEFEETYLSEQKPFIESYCTFQTYNITETSFDLNVYLDTIISTNLTNGYLKSAELIFSNVILDEDQPVICHTFGELKKKYSLEGNTEKYDLYSELLANTKTAFSVNEDGEQVHNKLVMSDPRSGSNGVLLEDAPNLFRFTIYCETKPHWQMDVSSSVLYDSSNPVSEYEITPCFNPEPTPTPTKTPTYQLFSDLLSVEEGSIVKFTLNTSGFENGSKIPWEIKFGDSSNIEDIINIPSGSFDIQNDTGVVEIQITEDFISEGSESFTFHALDQSVQIEIIDTTITPKPNPSTITPTDNNAPTWSWNSIGKAVIYEISLNDEVVVESQTSTSFTPNMLEGGFHTIKVRAKKSKGNWSEYGFHTVEVDLIAPDVPQPTTTSPTNNKTPTWTWSENEDVAEYEVMLDNIVFGLQTTNKFQSSTLSDGTHEIKVRAKDSVGNWSAFGSHTILIDTTSPSVPRPFTISPTNNNTPTWSWLSVDDAVLYEITLDNVIQGSQESTTFTSSTLQDGIHEIKIRSKDEIGNWSGYGSHVVLIDTLAPILPNPSTTSPTNNNKPMWTWTASNDAVLYEVKLNDEVILVQTKNTFIPFEPLDDGISLLEVRAKDKNNNWSEYALHEVLIDTTPPEVPTPLTTTPTNNDKPTWTWEIQNESVLYEVYVNEVGYGLQSSNSFTSVESLPEGTNEIKVRAKDAIGNWSSYGSHVVVIDTHAPKIPNPISETPTNNINPTWSWESTQDSVLYEVVLDNIEQGTQTENSFTANSLSHGNHEIKVKSQDNVGNWSNYGTHTIYVDISAPSAPIIASKSLTSNLQPTWTWNNVIDAVEYEVTLNDQLIGSQTSTIFKPDLILEEGLNELKVRAKDAVGNYSEFATNIITIDITAPNIPEPSTSSPTSNNKPTWNWSEIPSAEIYEVTLNGIIQGIQTNTSFTSSELKDGTNEIKVRARDSVGNYSSFGIHVVEVDTTSTDIPEPFSLTPTNNVRPTWNWPEILDAEEYEITLNDVLQSSTSELFYTPNFDLSHGKNEIKVRAKDAVGNWSNYGSHIIFVDLIATDAPSPNTNTPTNNLRPTWTWEQIPDAVAYNVYINENFIKQQTKTLYQVNFDLDTGLHEIKVYAIDAVGNISDAGLHIVEIDNIAPNKPNPNTESPTNKARPSWTWNLISDAVEYEVVLNNIVVSNQIANVFTATSDLSSGTHELKVRAKDAVGNYSEYGVNVVEIDLDAPDIPRPSTQTPTNVNTPTWTWQAIEDAVEYEIILNNEFKVINKIGDQQYVTAEQYTSDILNDGNHEIKVRAKDSVGNWSSYGSHVVTIDTMPPPIPQPKADTPTRKTSIMWTWQEVTDAIDYEILLNNIPQDLQTNTTFKIDNLSEGNHEIKVRAKDEVGNYSDYGTHVVYVDLTSPEIPSPITTTPTNNTSPTWVWTEVIDAIEYDILIDDIFQAKQNTTSFTASNLTEGTHEIKICATDSVGNKSEYGSHVVSIDLSAPNIPHPKTITPTSNTSPVWTWDADDDVVEYEIKLDSISQGTQTENSFTASNLSEGNHEIKVRARDSVGNYSAFGSHVVSIDLTSPNVPQPNTETPTNNNSPTWSWSSNPDAVEYEITLNDVILGTQTETTFTMPSLEDGFHEIKVRAKDSVGNWSQYGTHVAEIDTIPPTIPTPTTSSPVNNTSPEWTWSVDEDVVEYEIILDDVVQGNQTKTSFIATALPDGNHVIKVRAKDAVGNWSAFGIHYITIDTTPPVVPIPTSDEITSNDTPTWSWTPIQDAVLYEVVLNNIPQGQQSENTFTSNIKLTDGLHEIRVRAKDSVGNYSAYGSHIVIVDLTAPNIPEPNTDSPTNNNKPLWIWNSIHDAVVYEVTLDGVIQGTQNNTTFKPSFTLIDGEHELKVRAKDEVGNFSDYGVNVVIIDTTAPSVPSPTTTSPTSNDRPVWTWQEIDDAILYEITLNNIVIGNQTETIFSSNEVLNDGTHEIKIRSKDLVGNYSAYGTSIVQIDKTAPNIPSPNTISPTKNNTPTWTWNAIADATEYEVILDNIVQGTQVDSEFTSPNSLSEGSHEIKVRAKDAVGNWSVYGSHVVVIDSTAPDIPNPQTDTPTNNNKPSWSWSPVSDAVLYEVNLNGVAQGTQTETFFKPSFVLTDGLHELRVRSQDVVGNWSDYGLHILLVDTTPTNIPSPNTQTPTNNEKPTWTWSDISDAILYEVTLDGVVVSNQTDTSFTSSKILSDGNHELKVRAKDSVGNWSDYGTHVVLIDKTPTSIPSPVTNTPTNNNMPTWSWSPISEAVEYEVVLDNISQGIQTNALFVSTSTLSDGTHELKVRAKDAVGNWSAYGIHIVEIDTTAPDVPVPFTSSPTNNNTPTWSWSKVPSSVEYEIVLNGVSQGTQTSNIFKSKSTLSDGNHEIKVRSKDSVGNWSLYGSHTIEIDTTPPSAPSPSTSTPTNNQTPEFTWEVVDDANAYEIVLNNVVQGVQNSTSFVSPVLSDGNHEIKVRAIDELGNYSSAGSFIVLVDTTPPAIPKPNTTTPTPSTTPTWTWSIISDAVLYEITLNNILQNTQVSTSYTSSTLSEGTHEIKVRAKDFVGNWSAYGTHIVEIIDVVPPNVPNPTSETPTKDSTPTWTWSPDSEAFLYEVVLNDVIQGTQTTTSFTANELLSGTHVLKVRAQDDAGNWSDYGISTIFVDITAPSIPKPITTSPTNNNTPTWNWTPIQDAVLYEITLNNVIQQTQTETSFTPSALFEGANEIRVRAKDSVGNFSNYGSHIVYIDLTAPITPVPNTNTPTSNNRPTWTWSNISDAILYEVTLDGVVVSNQTISIFTSNTELSDGTHELKVRAKDNVGNYSEYGVHTILVDTNSPNIPSPTTSTPTSDNTPTWTWSAISDAVEYEVKLNGVVQQIQTATSFTASALTSGTHEISVRAKDSVGNWSDYGTHIVEIDIQSPFIPNPLSQTPTNDNTPTWNWSAISDAVEYEVILNNISQGFVTENSFTATTLSDGNHEIKVRAKDAVGNLSAFGTHNVLIDTIAPETPNPFSQTPTSSTTITWTWPEIFESIEYEVTLNDVFQKNTTSSQFTSNLLAEGNHEIKVRAKDVVGNYSEVGSHIVTIDISSPNIPQLSAVSPTNNNRPTWSWSEISDAVEYEIKLNDVIQGTQTETSYTPNYDLKDGSHVLEVRAKDNVGNYSNYGSLIIVVDTIPPAIPSPSTDTPTDDATPTWTWSPIADAVEYEVLLNGEVQGTQTITNFTASTLQLGFHEIKVRSKDSVGNYSLYGSHIVNIVDLSPPIAPNPSTSTPTSDNTPTWNWPIIADAIEYEITIDNALIGTQTENSFTSTILSDGNHEIKVRAKDEAGNYSEYGSHIVEIDTTSPNIPNPSAITPTNSNIVTWNWEIISDAELYEVTLNNILIGTQTSTSFVSPSELQEGNNEIKVRAKDAVGNWSSYGSHIVLVDTLSPETPIVNSQTPTKNNTPTWTWISVADAVSYEVSLNDEILFSNYTLTSFTSDVLDDGTHEIKVRAKDFVGNYSNYGIHSVVIDTTAPNIPQPNTSSPTNDDTPTWTWSAISEAIEYEILIDNVRKLNQTNTSYTSIESLNDGTHEIKVRAKDSVGNWSDYGINVVLIDTTSPNIPNPTTNSPTSDNTPTWTWIDNTDAVEYEILVNNVFKTLTSENSFTSSSLSDGNHEIKVRAKDAVGNWSNYGSHIVVIDTTAPNIPVVSTNSPTNDTTPTWTWSQVTDAILYEIVLDNVVIQQQLTTIFTSSEILTDGSHELKVRAKDAVGNWSGYGISNIVVDTTSPNIPSPSTTTPTNNPTPTWNWSAIADAVLYEVSLNGVIQGTQTNTSFTSTNLTDGNHELKVRSQDAVGNWSDYGVHVVTIDTTSTAIPNPETETPTSDSTPTWNWSETEDAVLYEIVLNNNLLGTQTDTSYTSFVLSDGYHELKVRSKDENENWSAYGSHKVLIDTTAPNIPNPTTFTPTNNKRPTWTWNTDSDVDAYEIYLDGIQQQSQNSTSFTPSEDLSDGSHTIQVRAKDALGNVSNFGSHQIIVDATPPSVPSPTTSTPTSNSSPTWNWPVIAGAVRYEVVLDEVTQGLQTNTFFNATNLTHGSHTIKVRSRDIVGNYSDYGIHVVEVDTQAPNIPVPVCESPTSDTTPTWNWSEIPDAVEYQIKINDIVVSNQTNFSFTSSALNDGIHEIAVRAKDSVGNYSAFGVHKVLIDTTAPNIPQPTTQTPTNDNTPTWYWSAILDATEYEIVIDGVTMGTQTFTSFTSTNLSDGVHEIKVRSKDVVGNYSAFGVHSVLIDTTPPNTPTITSDSPTNNDRPEWSWNDISDAVEYNVVLNDIIVSTQTETTFIPTEQLKDGTHTLKVRAKDLVGNYSDFASNSILIDTTAPSVPAPNTTSPTSNSSPTWNWNIVTTATSYEVLLDGVSQGEQTENSFSANSLTDGEHEIKVRAKDSVGNYSSFGSHTVVVDTTATEIPSPFTITPTSNNKPTWNWQHIPNAVSYEVYLNEQLQGTQITTFFESPVLDDGTHTIKVRTYDEVGNASLFGTHSVVIDTTAPNIPQPNTQTPTNDNTPTWTWNNISDATLYEIILDEVLQSVQLSNSFTSPALSDGNHTIKVRARDSLGNYSGYGFHVVSIDTHAPTPPIISVNTPTNDTTPTWNWNENIDIVEYEVVFNNQQPTTQTENSFTSTTLVDGIYELKVRGRDSNNNFSPFATSIVQIDTQGPGIPNPTTQTPTSNTKPTWTWQPVEDAVEYEIYLDDISQGNQTSTSFTSVNELSEGYHEIKVTAKDSVGNWSMFGSHSVIIDGTSPDAPSPSTSTPTNNNTPTWSWSSVNDAVSYEITLNNIVILNQTDTTFTSSYLNQGTHEIKVRAIDNVGNYSEYGTHVVTIDNTSPSIPSPTTSSPTNNTSPTWTWTAIENAVEYEVVLNNVSQGVQTETSFTVSQVLSEGEHEIKVRSKDAVGNYSLYGIHLVQIDTTAPDIPNPQTESPTNNSTPTWTWNSNADADEYEIFLNGVSQGTSNLTFFKSSILDDGTHEVKVRSKDKLGNYSSFGTSIVVVDTTPPNIPTPSTQTPTNNNSPIWTWSSNSDVIDYEIILDNVLIGSQITTSFTASNLSEGNHEIKVRAKDNVGNYSDYGTHVVTIDSTAPSIPNPYTSSPTNDTTPTWTWSEIQNAVEYEIILDSVVQSVQSITNFTSGVLTEGTHEIKVRAKDSVGNWSSYGVHKVEIDTTAPDAPNPTTNTPTSNNTITWSWNSILNAVAYEVLINDVNIGEQSLTFFETSILPEGNHEIKVRSKDSVGNYSAYGTHIVTIDTTAPNIPNPSTQTPTTNSSPVWNWNSISDAVEYDVILDGIIKGSQTSTSFSESNLSDGIHEIRVRSKDNVGNYSDYGTHIVTIDTTAPNTPRVTSETPTNNVNPTWSWVADVDVVEYEIVLNSVSQGIQSETSFTAYNLNEGEYNLQVRAKDAVGNWSAYGNHVLKIDTTAPSIPSPTTETPTNNSSPTWTWSSDSDVVEYDIILDGNTEQSQDNSSFTANNLADGTHEIKVRAKDAVGNLSAFGSHIITIKTNAPSIPTPTTSTPTNNSSVTWIWSQDNDASMYEITLDNILIGTQTSNNYVANNLSEGSHEIKVRAKDSVGNYSEYGTHIVVVDLTAPNTPNPSSISPTNNVSPTWSWSQNTDVEEYEIILDTISLGNQSENSFTAYNLSEGEHTIKVRAKDSVGNLSAFGTHTIEIDTTPPDVPSPLTTTPTKDQTPTWSWVHSDEVSSYEVVLNNVIVGTQTSNYFTAPTPLSDGTHEVKVKAIDYAGNESLYGTHIVTIDTTPPNSPSPNSVSPTNNVNPEWSWIAIQDAVLYEVVLDNIFKGLQTETNYVANNLKDGNHELKVRAIDNVGNYSEFGVNVIEIDSTPPSVPQPSSVTPTANPNPTWSWPSIVDAESYEVTIDNVLVQLQSENSFTVSSNLSEGSHTIKVRSKDTVGNYSEYGTHTIIIDLTAPGVPEPSTFTPTNNNRPTWTWSDIHDAVEYEISVDGVVVKTQNETSYTSSLLEDGSHEINVRAKDKVGNWSLQGSHVVWIDTHAPDVPIPNTYSPTNNTTPEWTWLTNEDVDLYEVVLDGVVQGTQTSTSFVAPFELSNGNHVLKVRARDDVGNWSDFGSDVVIVDTIPPSVPYPTTTSPTNNNKPTWTWLQENESDTYEVTLNNIIQGIQSETSFTPEIALNDGLNSIQVRAIDNVGNYSNYGIGIVIIDTTPPSTPSPFTQTPTSNNKPSWIWQSIVDAVLYEVTLNDVLIGTQTSTSFTSPTSLADGTSEIKVRAIDHVNNFSAYGNHVVVIDTTPPNIPNPSTQTPTNNNAPTWNWESITDAVEYEITIDNVFYGSQDSTSFTSPKLSDGTHTIKVRAKDTVGNLSDYGTHTILIDTTAPEIPIPFTDSPTASTIITWEWQNIQDAVLYEVILNNIIQGTQTSNLFTPSEDLNEGENEIKVRAKDSVGNWSDYGKHIVVVDTTPPAKPAPYTMTPTSDNTPTWTWMSSSDSVEYEIILDGISFGKQPNTEFTPPNYLSDGSHEIKVRAIDHVGNTSDYGIHSVVVDTTAPNIPIPTTNTPTNDNTPTWIWNSVADAVDYEIVLDNVVQGILLQISQNTVSFTAPQLLDGTHEIKVRARDAVGNYSDYGTHIVIIDTTAPEIPIPYTESPTQNKRPTWIWANISDAVGYEVTLNEILIGVVTDTQYTPNFDLEDGTNILKVRAIDNAGNYSAFGISSIVVSAPTPTPTPTPIVEFVEIQTGEETTSSNLVATQTSNEVFVNIRLWGPPHIDVRLSALNNDIDKSGLFLVNKEVDLLSIRVDYDNKKYLILATSSEQPGGELKISTDGNSVTEINCIVLDYDLFTPTGSDVYENYREAYNRRNEYYLQNVTVKAGQPFYICEFESKFYRFNTKPFEIIYPTPTPTPSVLESCCFGMTESSNVSNGELVDNNAVSGTASIDGTLCWNTLIGTALPTSYLCPFEVADFSKGGLSLTISAPLSETNNTFRYETITGECYEFKLENINGTNIGVLISKTDPTPSPTPTPTPTIDVLANCCDGLSESSDVISGSLQDYNSVSATASIDGKLCWNTLTGTALPQSFLCPFEVADFSKGGLSITIGAPISETNNLFRYETSDGDCYEFLLENVNGVNIGKKKLVTDTPTPTPTSTPTSTPTPTPTTLNDPSSWSQNNSNWSESDQNWNE